MLQLNVNWLTSLVVRKAYVYTWSFVFITCVAPVYTLMVVALRIYHEPVSSTRSGIVLQ